MRALALAADAQDCLPSQPLPPPGSTVPLDDFGSAVAVKDGQVLVGPRYDDNGGTSNAGSVQVFDATSGAIAKQLFPGAGTVTSAEGGSSVDADGGLAVMGSPYITTDDNSFGSAWIHDLATGAIVAELQPSEPGLGDRFGEDVAISGGTVVVGAPEDTPGSVWVFEAATGQQRFKWTADTPTPGDNVGWAVDLDGDVAITGAFRDSQAGQPLAGAAYLFDVTTGEQLHRLEEPTPLSGGGFGRSVAIAGDRALVAGGLGVYLFDVPTGQVLHTFHSPLGFGFGFGRSLALEGDRVVIGQPLHSTAPQPGRVWIFDAVTGDLVPGGSFSVTLSGSAPLAPLTFVLGLSNLSAPLKGGVLVPSPDLILPGLPTGPGGGVALPSTWPAAGLGCVTIFAQAWIVDASAPAGFTASNGLGLHGE